MNDVPGCGFPNIPLANEPHKFHTELIQYEKIVSQRLQRRLVVANRAASRNQCLHVGLDDLGAILGLLVFLQSAPAAC